MSDLLTHWAIHDDCRRTVLADPRFEPVFAQVLQTHNDLARLGAITRWGKIWMPQIVALHRRMAEPLDLTGRHGQRLAFALGGITHYAADFIMKPVMSRLAKADWNSTHHRMQAGQATAEEVSIREVSAYFDCHVFREVYMAGQDPTFSRFFLASNTAEPGKELEAFVRALFQRALLACHTLRPVRDTPIEWLDALIDTVQPLYLQIEQYTQVFTRPDPQKAKAYEVETTFYRATDPAIAVARAIQRGEPVTTPQLDDARSAAKNPSAYATAVALGVRTLFEAGDFWQGRREAAPDVSQG